MTNTESKTNRDKIFILYVDDEPELLNITKLFMEDSGEFRVDIISSAQEALNSTDIQSYDAVVSDYQMPDMDGISFLKTVREKFGDIPFILFMGEGCEEVFIQAINNGADFYLQKGGTPNSMFAELAYGIRQAVKKKRAEEALRKSEEKFRSFVENANEILFSLAHDGSSFTYVSPNVTELLGYDFNEVIGKSPANYIHPDDLSRNRELFIKTVTTRKKMTGFEYRLQHQNSTWRWYSMTLSPVLNECDKIVATQGICHDITERKKYEEALRKANRQLNLLTSITRHDILNGITAILGYLAFAETDFMDPILSEYIRKMKWATKEIQSQIEFTRIYEEIGSHEPIWVHMDTVMPRSSLPASVILTEDVQNVSIFADPMLGKVFFNLLDNAIRHGQRVTEIHVTTLESGNDMTVVWEDNGVGIADEDKKKIFERGFGKNTGLGMFLVREILSLTDITINENGEEGKGARFEIIVPEGGWRRKDTQ